MSSSYYTPRGPRHNNITLTARQYEKIADTLASSRRTHQTNHNRDEPSFIAETSFVRAPLNSRVSMGGDTKGKGKERADLDLRNVPLEIQEALILEDLLYVLMGIEGTYITRQIDEYSSPLHGARYAVSPTLDTSLYDLVQRILPLGTYYTAISEFIEQRSDLDFGLVNHALCAAIRDMLKDYQTLLSQLEHAFAYSPSFSLQKMWFYVHPTVHTLNLIYQLVLELAEADAVGDVDEDEDKDEDDESDVDPEEEARNEALGIMSSSKLKSILNPGSSSTPAPQIPVKGGEVLAILSSRTLNMSGDPTAQTLYSALLKAAGVPYVQMLSTWMTTGKLVDAHEEVMVKEARFIDRGILEQDYTDEYWERRYTLRDGSVVGSVGGVGGGSGTNGGEMRRQAGIPPPRELGGKLPGGACIPPEVEASKYKILLAGKYLNVIRECGIESPRQAYPDVDMDMASPVFYSFIEDAYTHANTTLLTLLLKDQMLIPRLRSLRRFFFLSHSSFLTHFLDLSHSELRKSAKSASIVKLQSLLELALGGEGEFKEDVKVTMARDGLYEWLIKVVGESGQIGAGEDVDASQGVKKDSKDDKKPIIAIDALAFDYTVKFPLSLVISRKTILRYQLLFRFLLHLKHVEQSLGAMWVEHMSAVWRTPCPPTDEFTRWRTRVFLLRARMLSFVQHILAFAAFDVLEPHWRALEAKLAKVVTVDQLLRDHVDFLDTCLKECMLTSSKLLKAFSRLIVTCSTFAMYTAMFTKSAANAGENKAKRWDVFVKFETNFNHWFKIYLDCVQFYASSDNVSLLPLVVRLNSVNKGVDGV